MINSLIESISISLNGEVGDGYNIDREEVRQGLEEPCFFILCISPASRQIVGRRYLRENQFCIQYFPEERKGREACYEAADRLFLCLEWLSVDGDLVRGTKMRHEIVDGILHFFVNYDMFVYKGAQDGPVMETVSSHTWEKGRWSDDR